MNDDCRNKCAYENTQELGALTERLVTGSGAFFVPQMLVVSQECTILIFTALREFMDIMLHAGSLVVYVVS